MQNIYNNKQARSNWGCSDPRFLLNFIFYEMKKNVVLRWKIVKTSWNSSKFIDISNITTDLDTRDGYPVSN